MREALQVSSGAPERLPDRWTIEFADGKALFREHGDPAFSITVANRGKLSALPRMNPYSAASAYIRGELDIEGDLIEAIRWSTSQPRSPVKEWLWSAAAKLLRTFHSGKRQAAKNVSFHYDRSNQFYRAFLDSRMVYSCAYFKQPTDTLDDAQAAKLDHICRKLKLADGDTLLDIGCGWGGLLIHAAQRYGALCTGCTLSPLQAEFIEERRDNDPDLRNQIRVAQTDFQQVHGCFDKIASVGMFEHLGHRRLSGYFKHIAALLSENGLFLNHGIARPETIADGAETLFLQRKVFPGGDLLHLSEVIRTAEKAGFEVLDVENLRPHYALTCRAWVARLRAAAGECIKLVDGETYRTWMLYLAACAVSFEEGGTDIYQCLFAKRSAGQKRQLTRDYIYH